MMAGGPPQLPPLRNVPHCLGKRYSAPPVQAPAHPAAGSLRAEEVGRVSLGCQEAACRGDLARLGCAGRGHAGKRAAPLPPGLGAALAAARGLSGRMSALRAQGTERRRGSFAQIEAEARAALADDERESRWELNRSFWLRITRKARLEAAGGGSKSPPAAAAGGHARLITKQGEQERRRQEAVERAFGGRRKQLADAEQAGRLAAEAAEQRVATRLSLYVLRLHSLCTSGDISGTTVQAETDEGRHRREVSAEEQGAREPFAAAAAEERRQAERQCAERCAREQSERARVWCAERDARGVLVDEHGVTRLQLGDAAQVRADQITDVLLWRVIKAEAAKRGGVEVAEEAAWAEGLRTESAQRVQGDSAARSRGRSAAQLLERSEQGWRRLARDEEAEARGDLAAAHAAVRDAAALTDAEAAERRAGEESALGALSAVLAECATAARSGSAMSSAGTGGGDPWDRLDDALCRPQSRLSVRSGDWLDARCAVEEHTFGLMRAHYGFYGAPEHHASATRIQACWRGFSAFLRALQLEYERQMRWYAAYERAQLEGKQAERQQSPQRVQPRRPQPGVPAVYGGGVHTAFGATALLALRDPDSDSGSDAGADQWAALDGLRQLPPD
eukprot:TRINITY_DN18654_c0_g1_i1.p1 TRINITY_DN18654_c0_g1~~TRINITY_DN18654_c0_g1_i1.p1  ORF type:complete len:651 (+),score=215.58 TRINITY_DN18654_c0_g1_i1:91-1953(+)